MVTHYSATSRRERVYRAIADPTRRAILDRLRPAPMSVKDLSGAFRISRPAISKHLRILRRSRLVSERKVGRNRFYRIDPRPLADVDAWLQRYRLFWTASLIDLKEHVEAARRMPRREGE